MEYLYLIVGVLIGSLLSAWIFWGMYQKEKQTLEDVIILLNGYVHLKNIIKRGK